MRHYSMICPTIMVRARVREKENITKSVTFTDISLLFLIKQLFHSRLLDTRWYSQRDAARLVDYLSFFFIKNWIIV